MTDRRRTRLRFRLCLAFTSIIAFLMVGQAVYVGYTTTQESRASQQRALQRDAERLAGRLAASSSVTATLAELRTEGLFQRDATLRQFLTGNGDVLEASDLLTGNGSLLSVEAVQEVPGRGSSFSLMWREGRRPAYAVAVPTSPPVVIVTMARRDWVAVQGRRLLRFELIAIPLSIALGAVLAWFTIGKQLRRLRLIVRDAEAVAAGEGRAREPSGPKDELFAISSALTEITRSLRGALDYQHRFAAQAAHELRTPLAIMKAESDLAHSSGSPEEMRQALTSVGEETGKLADLVQDLLAFGQSTVPSAPLEEAATADLVASATQPLHQLASEHGVELLIAIDHGLLRVSRVAVEHAIRNLVENAITSAPAGSAVRVSGLEENGWWRFAVEDSGPGVDTALGERIFAPFVGSRTGGHGLGLAFVKLIAEAHQGKAVMERSSDGTTRFCLILPGVAAIRAS